MFRGVGTAAQYAAFMLVLYVPTALVFYLAATRHYVATHDFAYIRLFILVLFAPIIIKYVIHLFIAPWYPLVESRRRMQPASYTPLVTVVIPARNEEVGIVSSIQSVLNTKYPRLEIMVMNNGSTDSTHDVVTMFIAKYRSKHSSSDAKIKYTNIPNSGKAHALNTALLTARGDIVITIDADSQMDRHAISHIVKHFTDPRVASVAGNVVIGNRMKPLGLLQQLEYLYGFYFKRADSILNSVYIVGGAAAAYRRKVIVALGGFDENSITEDIELSTHLQAEGHHVRYASEAIVYTEGPSDFKGLYRQRLRWKYGRLLTFYRYRYLFFSMDPKHNRYLSFMLLPIALFAEILLFFEGILLVAFYGYTFYSNDYWPLVFVIALLTSVVSFQILSDTNMRYHRNLILLAPGAWILFYIMDFVEYRALIGSIRRLLLKEKLSWHDWKRVGVFGQKA